MVNDGLSYLVLYLITARILVSGQRKGLSHCSTLNAQVAGFAWVLLGN
jgi:hypothetical protein